MVDFRQSFAQTFSFQSPLGYLVSGGLPAAARLAPDGPMGAPVVLSGRALEEFIGGERPLSDSSPMRSPIPPEHSWRVVTD